MIVFWELLKYTLLIMSLTDAGQTPAHQLVFQDVPEISRAELDGFFNDVLERRQAGATESYGAVVVRDGGWRAKRAGLQFLRTFEGPTASAEGHRFHIGKELAVHADRTIEPINDFTVLRMKRGSAAIIVLLGAQIKLGANRGPADPDATSKCITQGLLPGFVTVPDLALRATIAKNDVVFFDASQPHAVNSLTEDRLSTSHYLHRVRQHRR